MTKQQTILITGGAGSLGKALTCYLLDTRFDETKN
jgi:FlaA1/EpsC-like NDP-sugar epimerase